MAFYKSIAPYYGYIFPYQAVQLKFVQAALANFDSPNLLDIGCGTGILSQQLAQEIGTTTSIDLDAEMIHRAQQNATHKRLNFRAMNMLDIANTFGEGGFDAVLSFGNTLVHLPNAETVFSFFEKVYCTLRPNGKFLFQIINYDRIIDHKLTELPTIDNEEITFVRKYAWSTCGESILFNTDLLIKKDEKHILNSIPLLPLRRAQVVEMLTRAGFDTVHCYGNFKREEQTADSQALVVEAY